jgi:hypothetical protein
MSILGHAVDPEFVNPNFINQITGTAVKLELYNKDEEMLYFSIATDKFDKTTTLSKLTKNPQDVEFATLSEGVLKLGDLEYSGVEKYFFRFPADDFIVGEDAKVTINFGEIKYIITAKELTNYLENSCIYWGYESVILRQRVVMANCGIWVTTKGEPSLQKLVSQIIGDASTKEEKAQLLLDFVTQKIERDENAHEQGRERLKRADEVLMTKMGDCNEKAVLYASMLEQLSIDYVFVYFQNHLAVAVGGDYGNENSISFKYKGKKFSIAETTITGFRIGKSIPIDPDTMHRMKIEDILFIQRPGKNSKIFNAKTGEALEFQK